LPGDFPEARLSGVPDRKLRSNFTPGTTPRAMRRAQWSAPGLSGSDLEKPKIAVVNSSSQLASCFSHLDQTARMRQRALCAFGLTLAGPNAHSGRLLRGAGRRSPDN
jgi:dihydroxyacid dehydratase/phosphogluconate dehydratase